MTRLLALLNVLTLLSCSDTSAPETREGAPTLDQVPPLDGDPRFAWVGLAPSLVGNWTDSLSEPGAVIHEHWNRTDGTSYSGLGFVMVEQDTVFIEHLSLAYDSIGAVSYDVRVPSQNEGGTVRFPLTACIGDSMVFENPAHDFPQRIVYAFQANGDWIARVSGRGKDGAQRGFSYRFKRVMAQATP